MEEEKYIKVVLDSCKYLGYLKITGRNDLNTICGKYLKGENKDKIHMNMDCKNCPDFENYSYEYSSTLFDD